MSGRKLTPETMMAKAEKACLDARLLLENGSSDGATNRAYYAMFDAARAALLASGASVDLEQVRTHAGLIGAFGNYLIKNGPVSKEMGVFLRRSLKVRMTADYDGDSVELEDARKIVEQAENFVAAMRVQFLADNNDNEIDFSP